MGRGCAFCQCGEEVQANSCDGCYKLHSYDWLEGLPAMGADDIFEVRFKNTRKGFYKNVNNIPLAKGDVVAVESSPGHDIGIISLTGDMVARQMRRVGFNPQNGEYKKIYRKAKPYDIEKWQEAIALEHTTMIRSRQIAADMGLNMKIGDVEYQGDKIKAIFYYIADERVDFRELIKVFAEQFKIRVEMKQIGARQEAGRIGGLGSCGRELCCASWISGFVSVTTNAARYQEISLNPQKLAGQCGKLKCCLVYELDSYMDARKDMPRVNQPLQAMDGEYYHVKSDILGRTMGFSTSPNAIVGLVTLPVERVREIIDLNRKGQKVDRIQDYGVQPVRTEEPGFVNAIGEESITRFDRQGGGRNNQRRGRGRNGKGGEEGQAPSGDQPKPRNNGGQAQGARSDSRNRNQPREGQAGDNRNRQGGQRRNDNRTRTEGGNTPQGDQTRRNNDNRNRGESRPAEVGTAAPQGEQKRSDNRGGRNRGRGGNRNNDNRNRPQGNGGQGGENSGNKPKE